MMSQVKHQSLGAVMTVCMHLHVCFRATVMALGVHRRNFVSSGDGAMEAGTQAGPGQGPTEARHTGWARPGAHRSQAAAGLQQPAHPASHPIPPCLSQPLLLPPANPCGFFFPNFKLFVLYWGKAN